MFEKNITYLKIDLFSAVNGNYELCPQPHFRVSSTNTIFSYAANSIRYFESVV